MALAAEERHGRGCLSRCANDEPVFVLRAQDVLAADLVERWAIEASLLGCGNDKVREAKELAESMRSWPNRKTPD